MCYALVSYVAEARWRQNRVANNEYLSRTRNRFLICLTDIEKNANIHQYSDRTKVSGDQIPPDLERGAILRCKRHSTNDHIPKLALQ